MRATNGPKTRARRKAIKKRVAGAWGTKHTSYKIARQTLIRSCMYAFRDRKQKKREFRKLWINRINSQLREMGYNYSTFINALTKANIKINRKMLSEMAISEPENFKKLVNSVMKK